MTDVMSKEQRENICRQLSLFQNLRKKFQGNFERRESVLEKILSP